MRTQIPEALRDDPDIAEMDAILRKCVHCGFCLSACPTYSLNGDERTSPRGRIYLIKSMIEGVQQDAESILAPIDSCLSCLACASACPSGVDYQHFIDLARPRLERSVTRAPGDAFVRGLLARLLPYPGRFKAALVLARLARPFAPLLESILGKRIGAMLRMAPARARRSAILDGPATFAATGARAGRVGLLAGCAQQVLRPSINEATVRLLNRMQVDVVVPANAGCCGALVHHLGRADDAHEAVAGQVESWIAQQKQGPLDAIVVNAAGCGTHMKDFGFVMRGTAHEADARTVADLARDVSEFLATRALPPRSTRRLPRVIYHDACSLLHGQKITAEPRHLLREAGFEVLEVPGKHFCCGSAGSYNLLQPDTANELSLRRIKAIEATGADVIATGNIGCLEQLARMSGLPVVHTVELLDWATGGMPPPELADGGWA
jgi:glycolate oxidase iron-sulfur subunit